MGIDLVGGARSIEGTVGFVSDKGLINTKYLTKKERKALRKAQESLGEGVRILRILGNHLENPKIED